MFTRSPKCIRTSSNGLYDEFKELSFTEDLLQCFYRRLCILHESSTRIIYHAFLYLSEVSMEVNVGTGQAIFYSRKLLRFPVLFVGVANKILFFTYPLTCFLTFRFISCIFLSSVRSPIFFLFVTVAFFCLCVAWSFGHSFFSFVFPVRFVTDLFSWHCSLGGDFILIRQPGRMSCY